MKFREMGAAIAVFLRSVGIFVLGFITPHLLLNMLKQYNEEGAQSIPWVLCSAFCLVWAWIMSRPSYTAASAALFWVSFFAFLWRIFPSGHDAGDPGMFSRNEEATYAPLFWAVSILGLALGIFAAIAGMVHSRRAATKETA